MNPIGKTSVTLTNAGANAQITGIEVLYRENACSNVNLYAQKAVIEFANCINAKMAVEGIFATVGRYETAFE